MEFQQSLTLVTTASCYFLSFFLFLGILCFLVLFWGMDALKFSARHSPHGEPVDAAEVVRAIIAGIEVQEPRVDRNALVERSRPVETEGACIVEATIVAIAGSGEEN